MDKVQKKLKINGKYVSIDVECIDMVLYFNELGMTTKNCCSGHLLYEYSIMFEDVIMDKDIEAFIMKFSNSFGHSPFLGKFNKWIRKINGDLNYNWTYTCFDYMLAKQDYTLFKTIEK